MRIQSRVFGNNQPEPGTAPAGLEPGVPETGAPDPGKASPVPAPDIPALPLAVPVVLVPLLPTDVFPGFVLPLVSVLFPIVPPVFQFCVYPLLLDPVLDPGMDGLTPVDGPFEPVEPTAPVDPTDPGPTEPPTAKAFTESVQRATVTNPITFGFI